MSPGSSRHSSPSGPGRVATALPRGFFGRLAALVLVSAFGASIHSARSAEVPALFVRACAPCHGKDGKARTPAARKLGVKDMTSSTLTEAEIRRQIVEGRRGADGSIKMPAFEKTLSPDEIDLLARYSRSIQAPTAKVGK